MPKCGKPCEVYSRVVGYHRPVQNWNKGKQAEFSDRKPFTVAGKAPTPWSEQKKRIIDADQGTNNET